VNKNTILFKFTQNSTKVQSRPDSYLNYPSKLTQILQNENRNYFSKSKETLILVTF